MTCTIIKYMLYSEICVVTAINVVKVKCLTHYRATHSSIFDALLNTAYIEQSIVCVHVCLQCTSRIDKGSLRGTLEIAIYNVLELG